MTRKTTLRVVLMSLLVLASGLAATMPAKAQTETIRFGTPQWPGATVKTEIASRILRSIGYDTEVVNASTAAIVKSIAEKRVDVDLAVWRPSQSHIIDPVIEQGDAVELVANITDALYQNAVPKYVWDAGVRSLADLDAHAERFDHTFYGIEAGNVGNEIVKKAIKNDTYELSDWKVVPSSTPGMLAQVGNAVARKQWVVFLGWQPHWMNIKFDMKYLEDPKGIWGKKSTVHTVVHPDFKDTNSNVTRFLKQMVVPKAVQSQWIFEYGYNDRPADEVARVWIAAHPDQVAKWLEGVTAADSDRPAAEVVAEQIGDA